MTMGFKAIRFTVMFNLLIGLSEGITSNIFCNMKEQTWRGAIDECISAKGHLVAYETVSLDKLQLKMTTDVWTADYALQTGGQDDDESLCGFKYLTPDILLSTQMFGSCYVNRYYLCESKDNGLEVFNGTRDSIRCKDPVNIFYLLYYAQKIKPGYYWTINKIDLPTEVQKPTETPVFLPYLCGAYSGNIGRYFVNCTTKRQSLCYIVTNNGYEGFDKSCFVDETISTVRAVGISHPLSTEANGAPSETQYRPASSDVGKIQGRKENESSLGLSVGLPLGLCVAVIGGVILSIFVSRRYKCWKLGRANCSNKKTVLSNNASSTTQGTVYFNNSYDRGSIHIFESKQMNASTQPGLKPMQSSIPEYAVVRKTPVRQVQGNCSSKENESKRVHDHVNKTNSSHCYTTVDVDPFLNSNAVQTSEYSFAKETESVTENDDQEQSNVADEEYDVTSNTKHVNTSTNIYNTLQTEEYGTSLSERRGDNTYNILDMPTDQGSQTVYDAANHLDHSVVTNNIYNHLS